MVHWASDLSTGVQKDIILSGMGEKRDPIWLINSDQLITGLTG